MIYVPISIGEYYDKLSILYIKRDKIKDIIKLEKVNKEIKELELINKTININLLTEIKSINLKLWEIEDAIRIKEKHQLFNSEFIQLARNVYYTNDKRCEIKNNINKVLGSEIFEVKSYEKYQNNNDKL